MALGKLIHNLKNFSLSVFGQYVPMICFLKSAIIFVLNEKSFHDRSKSMVYTLTTSTIHALCRQKLKVTKVRFYQLSAGLGIDLKNHHPISGVNKIKRDELLWKMRVTLPDKSYTIQFAKCNV